MGAPSDARRFSAAVAWRTLTCTKMGFGVAAAISRTTSAIASGAAALRMPITSAFASTSIASASGFPSNSPCSFTSTDTNTGPAYARHTPSMPHWTSAALRKPFRKMASKPAPSLSAREPMASLPPSTSARAAPSYCAAHCFIDIADVASSGSPHGPTSHSTCCGAFARA